MDNGNNGTKFTGVSINLGRLIIPLDPKMILPPSNPVIVSNSSSRSDPYKGTSLVHLKRQGGVEVVSCDIYIGRQQYQGGWKLPRSIFYNPYSVKQYGLNEALILYRIHITSSPELLAQLNTLVGKKMGCWCTNCTVLPHPSQYLCHGQILMELIAERVSKGEL